MDAGIVFNCDERRQNPILLMFFYWINNRKRSRKYTGLPFCFNSEGTNMFKIFNKCAIQTQGYTGMVWGYLYLIAELKIGKQNVVFYYWKPVPSIQVKQEGFVSNDIPCYNVSFYVHLLVFTETGQCRMREKLSILHEEKWSNNLHTRADFTRILVMWYISVVVTHQNVPIIYPYWCYTSCESCGESA